MTLTRIDNLSVLTLDDADRFFPRASVLLDGDRIRAIETGTRPAADRIIDGRGQLAMPGLINAHAHMELSAIAGTLARLRNTRLLLELLPLVQSIWNGEADELIRAGYEHACYHFLRHGITAVNTMDYRPEAGVDILGASGLRALMSHVASDRFLRATPAEILSREQALIEGWDGTHDGRIRVAIGCQGDLYASRELWTELARLRRSRPRQLFHTHLFETGFSRTMARMQGFGGSTEMLDQLNLLDGNSVAAHLTRAGVGDVERMAGRGAAMLHCPSILAKYDHSGGWPPVGQGLRSGLGMGLGLDDHYLLDSFDLFAEMRTARARARVHTGEDPFAPADLVRMTTSAAANALGYTDTGRLMPGHKADLVLLDLDAGDCGDAHALYQRLVDEATADRVRTVFVDGRLCVSDGEVVTLEGAAVQERARVQDEDYRRRVRRPLRGTGRLLRSLRVLHPAMYALLPYRLVDAARGWGHPG
jgi:cytosine/adenosine deaminase-related metal-dependent hydrolase